MDIFGKVNEIQRESNKKDATVFKIEKYELDRDPKKCAMIGHDMLNMDENGVPKKVKVLFNDPSGKSQNIKDYADESSMSHTMPGGMVRLDKLRVNADGSYVCSHMQRISKQGGLRNDRNGNQHETGIARAWTKVLPLLDDDGNIAELTAGSGNKFSRGRAMLIPEESKGSPLTFGDNFKADLKAAAKRAIDAAPDKTKPILLLRQEANNKVKELVIPNTKPDESGNYVPMTKEEQLAIVDNLKMTQNFYAANEDPKAKGVTMEAVPGFQVDVYGMLNDPKSGTRLDKPRVQTMVNDTARQFALPKKPGQKRPDMVPHDQPEYKLSVVSYEIPKSGDQDSANLTTLGTVPGKTASPNAGLTVTPNPYYENPNVAQAEKASQQAAQNQGAQQTQAASQGAQNTQATQTAAQEAPATEAPANQAAQQPTTPPQQPTLTPEQAAVEEENDLADAMEDMDDIDMDDLEDQLRGNGL